MKKIVCSLLGSLLLFAAPAHADWVFLSQQSGVREQGDVRFTNFVTSDYNDYIFIIDMMEPLGGFVDVIMQVSTDGGTNWTDQTYIGGSTSIRPRGTAMNPISATLGGMPITNVDNQGYYFIGELRLCNINGIGGTAFVKGFGQMGNETFGTVFGTFGIKSGINAVRFVSSDPVGHPEINRYDITVYGLN